MVHFRAAVAHVICRGRHVAVSICYTYKSLDAVVSECGNNVSVRTAFLYALQRLSAAACVSCLHIAQCVFHACHQCMAASFHAVCGLCLCIVRQSYLDGTIEHVIGCDSRGHVVKGFVEGSFVSQWLRGRIVSFRHASECVIHVPSAYDHHVLGA